MALEIIPEPQGYRWNFLGEGGHYLWYSDRFFASDVEAFDDGKDRRADFWRLAALVDDYRDPAVNLVNLHCETATPTV